MLTIRLSRTGKKKKPMYRLIISEKARDPYGRALEVLGSYNPFSKELKAKEDRIKYWLSHGAGMSPAVNNLLVSKNIIKGAKVKSSKTKKNKKEETRPEPPKQKEKLSANTATAAEAKDTPKPADPMPEKENNPKEKSPAKDKDGPKKEDHSADPV